ncbi:MAG TPA: CstA-like transporter-associated (seleno)protein [Allosphingosinicella sp.]|jgi:uncharacterized short protein YbdD (DUF466 family)
MRLRDVMKPLAQAARLMVGLPDYEAYLAHRRAKHPGEPAMSRAEFHRERTERRYARGAAGGCC